MKLLPQRGSHIPDWMTSSHLQAVSEQEYKLCYLILPRALLHPGALLLPPEAVPWALSVPAALGSVA